MFALVTALVSAVALSPVDEFISRVSSSEVSFEYSYEVQSRPKVVGSGHGKVQGKCYVLEADGLRMISNGKTKWTADDDAMELVIEDVAGSQDIFSNPARLLTAFDKVMTLSSSSSSGGRYTAEYVPSGTDRVKNMQIVLSKGKDGYVVGRMEVVVPDGTRTVIVFSSMKFTAKSPASAFTLSTSTLSSDWVITDLR